MKKPKPSRKGKVSTRRRAKAVTILSALADDPTNPPHVRAASARALLNDGRPVPDDLADDVNPDDSPGAVLILPDNQRSGRIRDAHGEWVDDDSAFGWVEGASVLLYRTPEELADIRRHLDAPLLLTTPSHSLVAGRSVASAGSPGQGQRRGLRAV